MLRRNILFLVIVPVLSCLKVSEDNVYSLRSEASADNREMDFSEQAKRRLRMRQIRRHIQVQSVSNPTYLLDEAKKVARNIVSEESLPSIEVMLELGELMFGCLLYTSPSPRD